MIFATFKRLSLLALVAVSLASYAGAQDHAAAARAKLETSVKELAEVRERIARERIPLSTELRELENKVLELRRERERMQRLVDNQSVDLSTLAGQVKAYDDEATYASNLLNDYLNRANASLTVGELKRFSPPILAAMNQADVPGLTSREKIEAQLVGVQIALDRAEANVGGNRFTVDVVLPGGKAVSGKYAQIGPLGYFAADAQNAGILVRGSSDTPSLIIFDPKATPAISSFIETGSGPLPVDATLGRALALATANETLTEHFLKGGLWMWPIAFFGVLAVAVTAFKLLDITSIKPLPATTLDEILGLVRQDKIPDALHLVSKIDGPAAAMLKTGLQNVHLSKELLEEFLFETLLSVKPKLERGVTSITLAASVAPLLGLLGTVTGMIETFKLLTLFGTGDAKSLSSGISQALITTEYGLVVAIPALILGAIVSRMVANRMANLESTMITFANGIAEVKETTVLKSTAATA
jgi:biopolymer transport protein ExbB